MTETDLTFIYTAAVLLAPLWIVVVAMIHDVVSRVFHND